MCIRDRSGTGSCVYGPFSVASSTRVSFVTVPAAPAGSHLRLLVITVREEPNVGRNAGRTGDHRPGRGPGYRQGRAGVLCADPRSRGWVAAGPGGHYVLHDDPLTAGHGRPVDGYGCDPDCDGSNFGLLEATVLPVGGARISGVAGQRQRRQAPAWSPQDRPVGRGVVVQGRRTADAAAQLRATCLLYTSDAADDLTRVDLGGSRII